MKKLKFIFIGWLLCHTLSFIGWQIQSMTYEWCVKHSNMPPAKVDWCASTMHSSYYHLGVALQFDPISYLFYSARSIIDRE